MKALAKKITLCNCFASLHLNRPGPTVHSRSWCPLGSRWHQCPHHQPLCRLILWQAHRDWVTGGKTFVCLFQGSYSTVSFWFIIHIISMYMFLILPLYVIYAAIFICALLPFNSYVYPWEWLYYSDAAHLLPWMLMIDESHMSFGTSEWDHFLNNGAKGFWLNLQCSVFLM